MDNEITTVESAEVQTDTRPIRDLIYIVRGQQVLLLHDTVGYHVGASLKDTGKKCFGISQI